MGTDQGSHQVFSMLLERFPFEIIALIYFFMGPYTQSQFGKTCQKFKKTLKLSDEFFENSGVLKVWHTHQIWDKEDDESQLKVELAHLLFEQPGVKLYARHLMHGVQPEFDPYAGLQVPFLMRLKNFTESRPVLKMTNIDPEVLALLVSRYPKEMLTDKWHGVESDFADQCDQLLLRSYGLDKRGKRLLKAVYEVHPIFLQKFILSCPSRHVHEYLGTGLICALLKRSRKDCVWNRENLDELSVFLTSPKEMKLLFKLCLNKGLSMSLDFLEKSLKFGITVSEIKRCRNRYSIDLGEHMKETTKQMLLIFSAEDEAFVMDYMIQFAEKAEEFVWTEDDNDISSRLGYSDAFRARMKTLHDEVPRNLMFLIKTLF